MIRCAFLVIPCLLLTAATRGESADVREIVGRTMGTTYSVKWVSGREERRNEEVQQAVDERLAAINRMMSTYDPESELSRFNQSRETGWFAVSAETATVVNKALEVARDSGGAFDPTVGRLVGMWSFGADHRTYNPPPAAEIEKALESVGYEHVSARLDPPALRKDLPDVELDLSAIAKGFGVDEVSRVLRELGLENTFVEIGGEVRTTGDKAGAPWTVGIEKPSEFKSGLAATIQLVDRSLATSGDYRNYFEKDGVRYSHTINPRTGRPIEHQLASVSVLADDCMTADALATTLMVLGPDEGREFAEELQIAAYFLVRDGDTFREFATAATGGAFHTLAQAEPQRGPQAANESPWLTFLITFGVFAVAIAGLAVGVIFSNRTLKGSCGGMSAMPDDQGRSICSVCSTPPEQCDEFRKLREKRAES